MRSFLVYLIMLLVIVQGNAQQKEFYISVEDSIWTKNNYAGAIKVIRNRIEAENYTDANIPVQLVYYKGVGYCCYNYIDAGIRNFDWIVGNFQLSTKALNLIHDQKSSCKDPTAARKFHRLYEIYEVDNRRGGAIAGIRIELFQPGVTVATKGGNTNIDWDNYIDEIEVGNTYLGEQPLSVGFDKLRQRLSTTMTESVFEDSIRSRLDIAPDDYLKRVGPQFAISFFEKYQHEYFQGKLDYAMNDLERSMDFMTEKYGLNRPPEIITIYIATNSDQFVQTAEKLHGIKVNRNLLGYSMNADLSIIAKASQLYTGTIKHELMHVLINHNYLAMAPWLSEGIPAIYEVSGFKDDQLLGLSNWRGRILDGALEHDIELDLEALVGYNWMEFNAYKRNKYNKNMLAVNHALARYFCMYLDEQGKLVEIFKKYTLRNPETMTTSVPENAVDIVEESLEMPIARINDNFLKWYKKKHKGEYR